MKVRLFNSCKHSYSTDGSYETELYLLPDVHIHKSIGYRAIHIGWIFWTVVIYWFSGGGK